MPIDLDSFWNTLGCGTINFADANSCMDSFKVVYRKPFSKYMLGGYYLGEIVDVDSISIVSPAVPYWHGWCIDSIIYMYALIKVTNQYFSPYHREIYLSPIPDDIIYDTSDNYRLFNYYRDKIIDTTTYIKKICVAMIRYEYERYIGDSIRPLEPILLRIDEREIIGSSNIEFCSQPFFEGYSTDELVSKKELYQYQLSRYLQFYHQLFPKECPRTP